MKSIKPVFTFPYHDPTGKYNNLLINSISLLKTNFSHVCVSATAPTLVQNKHIINILEKENFSVFRNTADSNIGDHFRNALKIAIEKSGENNIFFGFLDRTLFDLNTHFKTEFLTDINQDFSEIILFERSDSAWKTHPAQYKKIEQLINKLGALLIGQEVEMATCGLTINPDFAKKILEYSVEDSYSTGGEWILLSFLLGVNPKIKKVDWLAWEDPFIENVDYALLKSNRENDKSEITRRLKMNIPIINLLAQERFQQLMQ